MMFKIPTETVPVKIPKPIILNIVIEISTYPKSSYTVYSVLCAVSFVLSPVGCVLCPVWCPVCCVLCNVYCVMCPVWCPVCFVLYTVNEITYDVIECTSW